MKPLVERLHELRPQLAKVAQEVYDGWEQDEDGRCDWLGYGGICQDIAGEQADVLSDAGIDCGSIGSPMEQHVLVLAYNDDEAYFVDVPPYIYETGGGFCWKKIPGVEFEPDDINIMEVDRSEFIDEDGEFYEI